MEGLAVSETMRGGVLMLCGILLGAAVVRFACDYPPGDYWAESAAAPEAAPIPEPPVPYDGPKDSSAVWVPGYWKPIENGGVIREGGLVEVNAVRRGGTWAIAAVGNRELPLTRSEARDLWEALGDTLDETPPADPEGIAAASKRAGVPEYGRCPICGELGASRERTLNGNDVCVNGHEYPSADSIAPPATAN